MLELAERQAADIDKLEEALSADGVSQDGKLNRAVAEVRQARVALGRLLAGVDVPGGESTMTLRARKAASARWASRAG